MLLTCSVLSGATEPSDSTMKGVPVPHQPYLKFTTSDSLNRNITYFLSQEPRTDLPLVVYVQGSGPSSHFFKIGAKVFPNNGHATLADVARGRSRLLIVEKPGAIYLSKSDGQSLLSDSLDEFRREHTLPRWEEAIHAALKQVIKLKFASTDRVLVIGHSEGGLVAAKLSADFPIITHVAVLAGGGPSQLYDIVWLAESGLAFQHISEFPLERANYVFQSWDSILQDSANCDRLFFGHPFVRWHTFLQTSTEEQLLQTHAHIFVAQGTRDNAVSTESFKMLRAQLLSKGESARFDLIDGADHSFSFGDANSGHPDGWHEVLDSVITWYLKDK